MTQPTPQPQVQSTTPLPAGALATLEAALAAQVLAAYTAWLAVASAAVLAPFVLWGLAPDASALWGVVPQWEQRVDQLMDSLKLIARRGWEDTMSQLGLDIPFNPDDAILVDTLARTRNLMVRTPDEVYRTILHELGLGRDAGETPQQLAARVDRVLSLTGTENWPARAKTVAVTEVHRAYNFGAQAAALRAQAKFQPRLMKKWVDRDDARVRVFHREAGNDPPIPVGQPFIVGGESLMAPGDPSGSPSNVINCRCKMRFTWGVNSGRQR